MPDLRSERGKATRERIIAAARELFGKHGYEGTSIEVILAAAGIKRGALYHHFATKEALFDAVLDTVVADIAAAAAEAARNVADPVASLRTGLSAWLRMATDPAVQRIALLDPPAVVGWARWRQIDERHVLGGMRKSLRRIADTGRLPGAEVDLLAHMVLAAVSEAALMIAQADDPEAALVLGQSTVDTLLDRLLGVGSGNPSS